MKPFQQTLLEQMHIDEFEVQQRKELLDFTPEHERILASCRPFIHEHLDDIVASFYDKLTSVDEVARVIGDADTLNRLVSAQRGYILDLFDGQYDLDYFNNRLRIGLVHKRIGVYPKLFLSAIHLMLNILREVISKSHKHSQTSEIMDSLSKLINLDTTLVFDTYIRSLVSEIEIERDRAQRYASGLEEKVAERTRQLEEMSRRDGLTHLYNRRAFQEFLKRELAAAQRTQTSVSVVYIDVDKFKQVNDVFGHQQGDKVLQGVAGALNHVCRESDIASRLGGDEFAVVLPNTDLAEGKVFCERLIEAFKEQFDNVTLSIGVAQAGPKEFPDMDLLIRRADEQMYQAKDVSGMHVAA